MLDWSTFWHFCKRTLLQTCHSLLSVKPCMLFFIQTLLHILCTGAIISPVCFLDLFGPIAEATNPITWYFYGESVHVTTNNPQFFLWHIKCNLLKNMGCKIFPTTLHPKVYIQMKSIYKVKFTKYIHYKDCKPMYNEHYICTQVFFFSDFKRELHPKPKLSMFYALYISGLYDISMLEQVVWEMQKWL